MNAANTRNILNRATVALVALLMVLGTVSGVAVAAGTTDITVSAAENTLAPGETTEVTVAVSNADGGVGSADFRVETSDPSVVTVQDVAIEADASLQNVRGDETGQNINFAVADTESDTGEVLFLTVTVEAVAGGTASIDVVDNPQDAVDGIKVGDEAGGSYTIGNIGSASLTVEAANEAPTADAGTDQTVNEDAQVTLDATGSNDPDGDSPSYTWTQTGGPSVTLSDESAAQPTFTAPSVDSETSLTFELEASDGTASDTDTVTVTVQPVAPASFQVSNLDAPGSATQGDLIDIGATIQNTGDETATKTVAFRLDTDGDGDVADESNVVSKDVELGAGESTTVTFSGVDTSGISPGDYTHGVATADDTATAQITIEAANSAPTADAGADLTVDEETTVTLDATGSNDPDGDSPSYTWTQTGGPSVTLSDASAAQPTFTAPSVDSETTLTFEVSVSDGDITDTDTVNVTVQPVAAGTTDILVTAGGETLAPDETTNVTVAVSNADGGVGSADLRVELTNSSVAAIQDVTIEADAGFQNVRGDETGQDINFAAATTETDTGEVIFLRVTVKATEAGSTDLVVVDNTQDSVDGVDVGDEAGNSYIIENIGSASLTVEEEDETPPPIDGFANAPTDPDGDGLYEDVNGDSEFNIVDVQALFANLDDETVENNPDKFDFNQDGDVDVVDVQKLFNEVNSK